MGELKDLCGADVSEVKGVKEEQEVLVLVVFKGDLAGSTFAEIPGLGAESRGQFADCCSDKLRCHRDYIFIIEDRGEI